MSFLSKIKENRASPSGLASPTQWLVDMFNPNSASGQNVTEENAMNHTGVYSAVRVIAETIASLPLNVYADLPDGGKKKAKSNYLYPLLHNKPNDLMTSFTWRETMLSHLLLWGNHYSQLELGNDGKIKGIWPLMPGRMQVKKRNKRLYYDYTTDGGKQVTFDQSEILHIPGLGFDGLVGKSVISMAKEAIGLGLSAEEFGARFFSQGAQPGGIIEYPGQMSEEAYQRYKKGVNKKYSGVGNSHKIMVLEEGLKYHQTSISPDDAQFLETRKFQIEEVARIFRVPPHMLADLERATFSNIEQQSINFVVNTIRPWLVRIEQVLNDKLISDRNNSNYIKFVVEGLLRGDAESRAAYYREMSNIGAMTINEIREKEDMNPLEDGDRSFVPLNMIPLSDYGMSPNAPINEGNSKRHNHNHKETRAKRNASKRMNIRERYKTLVKKSADSIVKREVNKVKDVINKELKSSTRNTQNFRDEIVKFYSDKFPGEIQSEVRPVLNSLAKSIAEEAANEINYKDYDIDEFFEDYLQAMAGQHAGYSRGQLLALIDEAENTDEAIEMVEGRLDDWSNTRAQKLADRETVKLSGAVTRNVFTAGGVTQLIWVANAGACPICQEMDGKVVGIEQNFAEPSDTILPDEKDFSPSGSIGHPPLHSACSCGISSY